MEFCANPPYNKVLWIIKDKALRPGDTDGRLTAQHITVSWMFVINLHFQDGKVIIFRHYLHAKHSFQNTTKENCHQAVLHIAKVIQKDAGEVSLIVRSAQGLTEGIFNVNLTYASGFIVQSSDSTSCHVITGYLMGVIMSLLVSYF